MAKATCCDMCERPFGSHRPKARDRRLCVECFRSMQRDRYRLTQSNTAKRSRVGANAMNTKRLTGGVRIRRAQIVARYARDVAAGRPIAYLTDNLDDFRTAEGRPHPR